MPTEVKIQVQNSYCTSTTATAGDGEPQQIQISFRLPTDSTLPAPASAAKRQKQHHVSSDAALTSISSGAKKRIIIHDRHNLREGVPSVMNMTDSNQNQVAAVTKKYDETSSKIDAFLRGRLGVERQQRTSPPDSTTPIMSVVQRQKNQMVCVKTPASMKDGMKIPEIDFRTRGVMHRDSGKFEVNIHYQRKQRYIGKFHTLDQAALVNEMLKTTSDSNLTDGEIKRNVKSAKVAALNTVPGLGDSASEPTATKSKCMLHMTRELTERLVTGENQSDGDTDYHLAQGYEDDQNEKNRRQLHLDSIAHREMLLACIKDVRINAEKMKTKLLLEGEIVVDNEVEEFRSSSKLAEETQLWSRTRGVAVDYKEISQHGKHDTTIAKAPPGTLQERVQLLKAYHQVHGHFPTENQNLGLAQLCSSLRQTRKNPENVGGRLGSQLNDGIIAELDSFNFNWSPNHHGGKDFFERIEELRAYQNEHGDLDVNKSTNISLYGFCQTMRKRKNPKKPSLKLSDERIKALDKLGFQWETPKNTHPPRDNKKRRSFSENVDVLRAYKEYYGHIEIPKSNKRLFNFCRNVRIARMNPGRMKGLNDKGIKALDDLGFQW